ncbi:MAG: hypothetical protein N2249_06440 [Melioribacter sp.]|nr:hypothetical protein [Melioribacter sp.]
MSSFSCQFLDFEKYYCIRLRKDCIPGRTGCVLKGRFVFAIPAEKRVKIEEKNSLSNTNNKKSRK